MEASGSQENIFKVRQSHIDNWKKKSLSDECHSCEMKIKLDQLCHSKLVGEGYQKRHLVCAIKFGVVRMSILDYKIWAAGLKPEKEFFTKMLADEARRVRQELQEQVSIDYPYLKVEVTVVPPRRSIIPAIRS